MRAFSRIFSLFFLFFAAAILIVDLATPAFADMMGGGGGGGGHHRRGGHGGGGFGIPGIGGGIIISPGIITGPPPGDFEEDEPPPRVAQCDYPEVPRRGRCACAKGFKRIGGECARPVREPVREAACGANEIRTRRGACVCARGYVKSGHGCERPPKVASCGPHEFRDRRRNACLCTKGFSRVDGVCARPPRIVVEQPPPRRTAPPPPPPAPEEPPAVVDSKPRSQPAPAVTLLDAAVAAPIACLAPDLFDLLSEAYGKPSGISRCQPACVPKPLGYSKTEIADMATRYDVTFCESCVALGGYLPLLDVQRIEKAANITLCMSDGWRMCAAPGYARIDRTITETKLRDVFRALPRTVGKDGDIAVVIGNEAYADNPSNTTGVADADAVTMLLTEQLGYKKQNIIDLRNASKADFERVFGDATGTPGELAKTYGRDRKGGVFIYISSHGLASAEGETFLVPVDAKANDLAATSYPLAQLYKGLEQLGAPTVILALESEFGTRIGSIADPPNLPESEVKVMPETAVPGLAILTATDRDQHSLDDPEFGISLFTKYLIEALAGKADLAPTGNDDKRIDTVELYVYASNMVRTAARKSFGMEQKPLLSRVENVLIGRTRGALEL